MANEKFLKYGVTAESLADLYSRFTDQRIADSLGVSENTIRRWRKECGIATTSPRQRRDKIIENPLTIDTLTEERLRALSKQFTDVEIGVMHGVSKFPILNLRDVYGIPATRHGRRTKAAVDAAMRVFDTIIPPVDKAAKMADRLAAAAARARKRRAEYRLLVPAKLTRTFTCTSCGTSWESPTPGNFVLCAKCRGEEQKGLRLKACGNCGKSFMDSGKRNKTRYCSSDCCYRAKLGRLGKVPTEGRLQDRKYLCPCGVEFVPEVANQKMCKGCINKPAPVLEPEKPTVIIAPQGDQLYLQRYPGAREAYGAIEDADGVTVGVRSCRRHARLDCPTMMKWSFRLLSGLQVKMGHQCDVYSCLCLGEGGIILREYRIPVDALGEKDNVIDINEDGVCKWDRFLVVR